MWRVVLTIVHLKVFYLISMSLNCDYTTSKRPALTVSLEFILSPPLLLQCKRNRSLHSKISSRCVASSQPCFTVTLISGPASSGAEVGSNCCGRHDLLSASSWPRVSVAPHEFPLPTHLRLALFALNRLDLVLTHLGCPCLEVDLVLFLDFACVIVTRLLSLMFCFEFGS